MNYIRYNRFLSAWLGLCLLVSVPSHPVEANGLPVTLQHSPSAMIVPNANTGIEVLAEELTFDFRSSAPSDTLPLVTAKYQLKNRLPKEEQLQIAFLYLEQANDLRVTWNGQEIPLTVSGPDFPEGWLPPQGLASSGGIEAHWLDPVTGKVYLKKTIFANGLHASLFPLTMAAGSEGVLSVSYHQSSTACDRCNDRKNRIYHFTYLLSPARYWAAFEDLTIQVIGPKNYSIATEPELAADRIEDGHPVLTGHFTGLPPGEFHLSIKNNAVSGPSAITELIRLVAILMAIAVLVTLVRLKKKLRL